MPERIKITDQQKQKLIALTVASLGVNPSAQGYSAETIQKHLYQVIAGLKDHITDEDANLVNYINNCLGGIQDITDQIVLDVQNALSEAKSYADSKSSELSERINANATAISTEEEQRRREITQEATERHTADEEEKLARQRGDETTLQRAKNYAEEYADGAVAGVNALNEERLQRIEALDYSSHIDRKDNPHKVTKEQVGLENVENKGMDDSPTQNSDKYVKSGGVYQFVKDEVLGEKNRVDGVLSDYQQKQDSNLETQSQHIVGAINEVNRKIDNASSAVSYATYQEMITDINSKNSTALKVGTQLFIQADGSVDMRIISIENSSVPYTYTTDSAFEDATNVAGGAQIGYYKVAPLKAQKVDLTQYVKYVDIAEEYSSSKTYAIDEIVCRIEPTGGKFYICNTAITTPEAFNVNKWTLITLGDAIESKANRLVEGTNVHITRDQYGRIVISADDTNTTYESKQASEGGSDVSLVTTGEKWNWNNKQSKLNAGANITIDPSTHTISSHDTTYQSKTAVNGGSDVSLVTTGEKAFWNSKQESLANLTENPIVKVIGYDANGNLKKGVYVITVVNTIGGKSGAITLGNGLAIDNNNELTAIAEIEVVNLL